MSKQKQVDLKFATTVALVLVVCFVVAYAATDLMMQFNQLQK